MTDTTFDAWMKKVDHRIKAMVGLSYRDLPDRNWRDMFDAGWGPREAADMVLSDEGFDTEED